MSVGCNAKTVYCNYSFTNKWELNESVDSQRLKFVSYYRDSAGFKKVLNQSRKS